MAKSRFENLPPERRETILEAAGEEFAGRGYAGAALSRIIEAAGISKGSLYYYFEDKADLFNTVVMAAVERMLGDVGGMALDELTASSFWDTVREVGLRSVELTTRDAWYVRLALAFPRLREEPQAGEAVKPALEWGRQFTRSLLGRGRELRVVRRDLPLELLVEITMAADEAGDRWMMRHWDEYGPEKRGKLIEARIDLMRDMLDAENEGWE